jgi:integrase
VIDVGEQPWRKCPTPRCGGSAFIDSIRELACERCGAPLELPVLQRKRVWTSGFKSKTEANRALTRMLGDADQGMLVEPSSVTLREFVEKTWLPSVESSDLRESTIEMYRRSVKRYVLPNLGQKRLRDVTPARLASWLEELKASGVGDRTVEIAGITCHKVFKSALDRELISRNPADNAAVRSARPKAKAKIPIIWTAEQTRSFLDAQRDDRLFALWRLATMTGLRRGELAGARWSDLDLDTGTLRVSHTRVVVGYKVVDSTPKTSKGARVIGLDPATVAALKSHWAKQAAERLVAGELWEGGEYLFCDERGHPYHPQRFTQMLAAKAKAAKLPPVKVHALRHGHATAGLEAGVDMKVMSERLGHSSIQVTADIYQHVSAAVDQAAAYKVAAAIDGGRV